MIGLALFLFSASTYAQRISFIYVQSEADQPFFIKLAEQTWSSGTGGYIILPKLKDSTYLFKFGFPQNKWPEQYFQLTVKGADQGWLLKNFGEKGWGLFNLQTMQVLMATPVPSAFHAEPRTVSPFTEILAKASDDPSLRFTVTRIAQEPVALIEAVQAIVPDTVIHNESAVADVAINVSVPDSNAVFTRSIISKHSETSTTEGLGLTFLDAAGDNKDTIRILIPEPKGLLKLADSAGPTPASKTVAAVAVIDQCKGNIGDGEYNKLRKKMAGASGESDMLDVAGKATRNKCLLTAQVRELGQLFPGDGGRFKLYDLVSRHVSDPVNFPALREELKDEYFIDRFQALVRTPR